MDEIRGEGKWEDSRYNIVGHDRALDFILTIQVRLVRLMRLVRKIE